MKDKEVEVLPGQFRLPVYTTEEELDMLFTEEKPKDELPALVDKFQDLCREMDFTKRKIEGLIKQLTPGPKQKGLFGKTTRVWAKTMPLQSIADAALLCYGITDVRLISTGQKISVYKLLRNLLDTKQDVTRLLKFKSYWITQWQSHDKASKAYLHPSAYQVFEHWSRAMAYIDFNEQEARKTKTTIKDSQEELNRIEKAMRR